LNYKKKIIPLKEIKTQEGSLFMIFRDWDDFHNSYEPKMVYVTTMKPCSTKGPILHKERKYYLTAITGDVSVEILNEKKEIETISLRKENDESFNVLMLEPNIPIKLINSSLDKEATIINCASKAWHPENQDTWKWNSWEEYFKNESIK
jgi:hypothetical protein